MVGTIVMVILMVALVVFAALTKVNSPQVRVAALVLMWSFLALTILSAVLLFTSAFFAYPKPLAVLLGLDNAVTIDAAGPENLGPTSITFDRDDPKSYDQDAIESVEEVWNRDHTKIIQFLVTFKAGKIKGWFQAYHFNKATKSEYLVKGCSLSAALVMPLFWL